MTIKERIDAYFNRETVAAMLEDTCRLIRIPSDREEPLPGKPYGEGPAKVLEAALSIAGDMGFAVRNYDNYVGAVDMNGGPAQLDILAHLDVVPVGDDWTVTRPFEPLVQDGRLYGRGSADDKGPAMAALYAMKAVKELGIPLSKNARLILGTDEECGSSDIAYYYKTEKEAPMTFSPDGSFPVINIEKGGLRGVLRAAFAEEGALPRVLEAKGGSKVNVVPDRASAVIEGLEERELAVWGEAAKRKTGAGFSFTTMEDGCVQVEVKGVGAHASTPEKGCNAVTALLDFLARLPLAGTDGARALQGAARVFPHGDWGGAAAGVAMEDAISGALTISLDVLEYSPTGLRGIFDCRASVCATDENMRDVIALTLKENGLELEPCRMYPPHHVPAESPFVQTLLRCYEQYTGKKGKCLAIGGGTYVHNLENGVAFGCSEPETDNHMHGADEFAYVDDLVLSARLFAQVIVELCS